jgi:hypothetical protein
MPNVGIAKFVYPLDSIYTIHILNAAYTVHTIILLNPLLRCIYVPGLSYISLTDDSMNGCSYNGYTYSYHRLLLERLPEAEWNVYDRLTPKPIQPGNGRPKWAAKTGSQPGS